MRGKAWAMCLVASVAMAGVVAADDHDQRVLSVVSKAAHFGGATAGVSDIGQDFVSSVEPVISASITGDLRDKLEAAFFIAASRVDTVAECSALFMELDTTGADMLSTTIYYPADPRDEAATCRRGSAFTWVGAAPTRVCRRFATLSDHEAAMVVIHEALHHAGLDERPRDRNAMSSRGINQMVREACGL